MRLISRAGARTSNRSLRRFTSRLQWICLSILLVCGVQAAPAPPAQKSDPDWGGSTSCGRCHEPQYEAWRGSHHDLAMQVASEATVLGNFDDSQFTYAGLTTRFYREGGGFRVATEGPDGKIATYEVAYVFGVYPLQQYLIPFPGGRLQTLSIAWDTRPLAEGGQRWFHLYPNEVIRAGDPLHWTGPYQNWNLQCAECHSTNLRKNYDPESGDYQTTWSELDVGCESCHGPGARHIALAEAGKLGAEESHGFPVDLAERGAWSAMQSAGSSGLSTRARRSTWTRRRRPTGRRSIRKTMLSRPQSPRRVGGPEPRRQPARYTPGEPPAQPALPP